MIRISFSAFVLALVVPLAAQQTSGPFDTLIIRHATLIDGTGSPAHADVRGR